MGDKHSGYLRKKDLKSIKKWIREVENYSSSDDRDWSKLRLPYNLIGKGGHRLVFDLKNGYVLKVATTLTGIENCLREAKIYKMVPDHLKKHLSKVKEQGDGWIIMKKFNHDVPKTKKNKKKVLRLIKKFTKNGIGPLDIISRKKKPIWRNIKIKDNKKIIIIDFGHFGINQYS